MGSWKSSICQHCSAPFRSENLPKQRYCSKRCGGLAKRLPVLDRLRAKLTNLHDPYDCWEWTGATIKNGYGTMKATDRPRTCREQLTHRMMWIAVNGPIPDGLLVLHHCDNRPCCNPRHLFLGTKKDNTQDAIAKGRHVYIPAGEKNPHAKLNATQVREIRAAKGPAHKLAAVYGVSPALIYLIRQRRAWKTLD